jgi:hypothetical protein
MEVTDFMKNKAFRILKNEIYPKTDKFNSYLWRGNGGFELGKIGNCIPKEILCILPAIHMNDR